MTSMKMVLLAGALTIASTGAFAQTIAPNAGANLRAHKNRAYVVTHQRGTDSYASADVVRWPGSYVRYNDIDPRVEANGYVSGGVSFR